MDHFRLNNVQADHLVGLIPGVIEGRTIGGTAASYLPEAYLRILFSVVLIGPGVRDLRTTPPVETLSL